MLSGGVGPGWGGGGVCGGGRRGDGGWGGGGIGVRGDGPFIYRTILYFETPRSSPLAMHFRNNYRHATEICIQLQKLNFLLWTIRYCSRFCDRS